MKKELNTTALIIGAGPIGLATAAKLIKHKIDFLIVEKGVKAGSNILEWGHVQLFSKWNDNTDIDVNHLLSHANKKVMFASEYSNGHEFIKHYLQPFSQLPEIKNRLLFNSLVSEIECKEESGDHHFLTTVMNAERATINSKFVIDASGTWGNRNKLLSPEPKDLNSINLNYDIPDVGRGYIEQKRLAEVVVIGSGHSAMNSLLELSKCSVAKIHWVIRNAEPRFGKSKVGGQSDTLEKFIEDNLNSGIIQLHNKFVIREISSENELLNITSESGEAISGITQIFVNIGHYPDYTFISNFNIQLNKTCQLPIRLASKVDPEKQSCESISYSIEDLSISSKNYFVVGMKSFGTASNFLLKSGYKVLDEMTLNIKKILMEIDKSKKLHNN